MSEEKIIKGENKIELRKVYAVAVVDDDSSQTATLRKYLADYAEEEGVEIKVSVFGDGAAFLDGYKNVFDIVFMDIDMPNLDGLNAARKLRAIDNDVVLLFVTNLAQYAIKGYEVSALDYLLKPLSYATFKLRMLKAVSRVVRTPDDVFEILRRGGGILYCSVSSIYYIEISGHSIEFYTSDGQVSAYGTMKSIEAKLPAGAFFRCNSCYLVNLRHVERIDGTDVIVAGKAIPTSRPRRREFMNALHLYKMGKSEGQ